MRISCRAIIFDELKQHVLLMYRRKVNDKGIVNEYFVVPGGGLEEGESLPDAAIRELKEELQINISIDKYIGLEETPQGFSNYFESRIISGVPKIGGEELERMNENNYYEPRYVPISELENHTIWGVEYILKAFNNNTDKLNNAKLTDQGICPTCYNRQFNNVIFGDNSHMVLFEDENLEVFFVGEPRKKGHTAIFTKKHFKDMMALDENLIEHVFNIAQKTMQVLKNTLSAESVYLNTMCDGPNNHFHLQLFPRYSGEKRGSINFVAERQEYVHDESLVKTLRKQLEKLLNNKQ